MKKNLTNAFLFVAMAINFVACNNQQEPILADRTENISTETYNRQNVIEQDSLALVALYNATDGKHWYGKNQWLENTIDHWEGVETDIVNGQMRVVRLNLGVMNLNGKIPQEIGQLTALKRLLLSENPKLVGTFPKAFFEMKNLEVLIIKYSGLEGEIPAEIGNLQQLDTLDLWGDTRYNALQIPNKVPRFGGKLPKEMGKLKKLRFLRIGRNNFQGKIPQEWGGMSNLNFMDIADCQLTGGIPTTFENLDNLVTLFASQNQLTNPIPSTICKAEKLAFLYLDNNQIKGEIPNNIQELKNLRTLSLSHNQLSGNIPPTISQNLKLGLLYLDHNQLSGSIPQEIAHNRCRLTFATFANNNLTGTLPTFPGNPYLLSSGELWYPVIEAQNNKLTGILPDHYLRWEDIARKRLLPQQDGFGFDNLR